MSAPAATATAASSARVTPQILTSVTVSPAPAPGAGSGSRMSAVPTSSASAPASRTARAWSGVSMPDSATRRSPRGRRRSSSICRPRSISSVVRSRALTPMIGVPRSSARSSSCPECTSTSASISRSSAAWMRSAARLSSTSESSTRMASAPCTRASVTCQMSTKKSLHRSGTSTTARTAARSAYEPPKSRAEVSTEIAAAPSSHVLPGDRGRDRRPVRSRPARATSA